MAILEALGQMGSQLAQGRLAAQKAQSAQQQQNFLNQQRMQQLALQARQVGQTDVAQRLEQARFDAQQAELEAGNWSAVSKGNNGIVLMNNKTQKTVNIPIPSGYGPNSKLIYKASSETNETPDGKIVKTNFIDVIDPNNPLGPPIQRIPVGTSNTIAPQAIPTAPTTVVTTGTDPLTGLPITTTKVTRKGNAAANAASASAPTAVSAQRSSYIQSLADKVISGAVAKSDVPAKYRVQVDETISSKIGPISQRLVDAAKLATAFPDNNEYTSGLVGVASALAKAEGKVGPAFTALLKAVQTPPTSLFGDHLAASRRKAISNLLSYLANPATDSGSGSAAVKPTHVLFGGGR